MADIRIKVGASADSSLTNVFKPLTDASKRAKAVVAADMAELQTKITTPIVQGTKAADGAFDKMAKDIEGTSTKMLKPAEKAIVEFAEETKIHFRQVEQEFREVAKESEKAADRIERAGRRANGAGGGGGGPKKPPPGFWSAEGQAIPTGGQYGRGLGMGLSVLHRAASMAASGATRLGGDYLSGIGLNTDPASMFAANTKLETQATDLTNAGYMSGAAGPNGIRQDPREIIAQMRKVGNEAAFDPGKAMEGLSAFVGKTGDLQTGRDVMKDLATLSRATGTNLEDMVDAAADVSNNLGDIPNKGEAIKGVMVQIAGEGKLGAVEIKDLATQMAKVASAAGQIEGDAGKNIALLGAFAQEARQRGGAASATQAATSVQGLINTFKTPKRSEAFEAATGKSVFNKQGMIRNPEELVIEALKSSGMDPNAFKKIFANVQGARAVEGFATIFRQAGGGDKGEAAVRAEFDRLANSALTDAEILDSFARSMRTTESQTQILNNNFQEAAQNLQDALIPAFNDLAPQLILFSKGLGDAIGVFASMTGLTELGHQQTVDQLSGDVETDVKNTHKQEGQGYILQAQLDKNEADEKRTHEAVANAKADVQSGKEADPYHLHGGDQLANVASYLDVTRQAKRLFGNGQSYSEEVVNKQVGDQIDREMSLDKAKDANRALFDLNRETLTHLQNGTLNVRVVNVPKHPPPNNPGAKSDGIVTEP